MHGEATVELFLLLLLRVADTYFSSKSKSGAVYAAQTSNMHHRFSLLLPFRNRNSFTSQSAAAVSTASVSIPTLSPSAKQGPSVSVSIAPPSSGSAASSSSTSSNSTTNEGREDLIHVEVNRGADNDGHPTYETSLIFSPHFRPIMVCGQYKVYKGH